MFPFWSIFEGREEEYDEEEESFLSILPEEERESSRKEETEGTKRQRKESFSVPIHQLPVIITHHSLSEHSHSILFLLKSQLVSR